MGRKRKKNNQGLEPNLYSDGDAFVYRNPVTGKRTRIKRSRSEANSLARKANTRLVNSSDNTLFLNMISSDSILLKKVCKDFYEDIIEKGKNKASTKRQKRYKLKKFVKDLGEQPIDTFTVKQLSSYLDDNFVNDAYIAHRAILIDVFKYAKAKGYYEGENPAAETLEKSRDKKARKRHTWKGLQKIIQHSEPWLRRAILIALYSLQRRDDLVNLLKNQIDGDCILLKQEKSEGEQFDKPVYLKIKMSEEFKSVVQECLGEPVLTPYLIHYKPKSRRRDQMNSKPHWTYVTPDHLTKSFAKARKAANAYPHLKREEQPTFHEIRALGAWIYEFRAGFSHEYVQMLMGHSTGKMTTEYQEGHEIRYESVEAGLSLKGLEI
ncbi:tyrosine-type recombinase/integrase [Endozoicomonas sp. ISHI1]|uniref:tyrosine-type recombinase/integrase n=1 Tax=Endozoicomonas sp. ISHI1 TaxID=2825882 RepID=UPI002147ECE2